MIRQIGSSKKFTVLLAGVAAARLVIGTERAGAFRGGFGGFHGGFGGFHGGFGGDGLSHQDENGAFVPIPIGGRALDVLEVLLQRPGTLVFKDEIMRAVWPHTTVESANLTIQISALRRVLDQGRPDGRLHSDPRRARLSLCRSGNAHRAGQ